MPIILNSTPSDPAANSTVDLDFYKSYISTRLPRPEWTLTATDDILTTSLIAGMRLLGSLFIWTGAKSTPTQSLPVPRIGWSYDGVSIPPSIIHPNFQYAQCEMSLAVGGGDLLSDNDAAKKSVASVKAGSVAVSFQPEGNSLEAVDALVRRLQPGMAYLQAPDAVRMFLDASWYVRGSVKTKGFLVLGGVDVRRIGRFGGFRGGL
jgi:hypothetical protein